jgi:hypothetical protein
MGLVLPDVGAEPGPTYASDNNTAFETVDEHDHTTGKGVAIPTAGLNINADLSFGSTNAKDLRTVRFTSQASTPSNSTDLRIVYVKNGELAYRDASGNEVLLTNGGSIAGATGSISGLSSPASASYSSVTKTFTWLYDSGSPAKHALGDLGIYPYDGLNPYSFAVTLKAPTALSANYAWTLPAAAASQGAILSVSTAGQLAYGAADGTNGAPSIPFSSDLDTGFYRSASGEVAYSSNGTATVKFSTNGLLAADGDASAPSLAFAGDLDTGFYRPGADTLSVATGGIFAGAFNSAGQFLGATTAGSTVPTYSFDADRDTGIYRVGSGDMGFSSNGTLIAKINDSGVFAPNGVAAVPGISFLNDGDTGLFRDGANQIGFSAAGSQIGYASAAGWDLGGNNTPFKVKVFSGSVTASARVSLTGPGTVVLGVTGMTTNNGGSTFAPMRFDHGLSTSTSDSIYIETDQFLPNIVDIKNNDSNSTNSYYVIMFYT